MNKTLQSSSRMAHIVMNILGLTIFIQTFFANELADSFEAQFHNDYLSRVLFCCHIVNSSIELGSVELLQPVERSIIQGHENSCLSVASCTVACRGSSVIAPFDSVLHSRIANISIRTIGNPELFPPLMSSRTVFQGNNQYSSTAISSSIFSSFQLTAAPFITSSAFSADELSKLVFSNISLMMAYIPLNQEPASGVSHISCCSFYDVSNVFYGGIVRTIGDPSFSHFLINNSFFSCSRATNDDFTNNSSMDRIIYSSQKRFIRCEWHSCIVNNTTSWDADGSGGAICIISQPNSEIVVDQCLFEGCYASGHGGAIASYYSGTLILSMSTFENCSSKSGTGGAISVEGVLGCCSVQNNNCLNCTTLDYGGGIYVFTDRMLFEDCIENQKTSVLFKEEEKQMDEKIMIFNCNFRFCSTARQYGGGLSLPSGTLCAIVSNCHFFECSSESKGGGMRYRLYSHHLLTQVLFRYLFFDKCSCRSDSSRSGHDIYLDDSYNRSAETQFESCYSTNLLAQRLCKDNGTAYYFPDWLLSGYLFRYVGTEGNDNDALCGMSSTSSCLTIEKAIELSSSKGQQQLLLLPGVFNPRIAVDTQDKEILITETESNSSEVSSKSLSASSDSLFVLSSGVMFIDSLRITHFLTDSNMASHLFSMISQQGRLVLRSVIISSQGQQPSSTFTSSLFHIVFSQLRFEDVMIRNFLIETSLFTEHTSSSSQLSMFNNVSFQQITRTVGNGTIISKILLSSEQFFITNTTLEDCSCSSGNGGGMYLRSTDATNTISICDKGNAKFSQCSVPAKRQDRGKGGGMYIQGVSDSWTLKFGDVSFEECKAWKGSHLFVEGSNLSELVNKRTIGFFVDISGSSSFDELSGFENKNTTAAIPLVLFLRTFSAPAFVSGLDEGTDYRLCGYQDYPCSSIEAACSNRFLSQKHIIRLLNSYVFDDEIIFDKDSNEIDVERVGAEILVHSLSPIVHNAIVINKVTTTIDNITFVLGEINGRCSFIETTMNEFSLGNCSLTQHSNASHITYSFITASGGRICVQHFSSDLSQNMLFDSKGMINVCEKSGCTLIDVKLSGVLLQNFDDGVIAASSSGSVVIQNCSFNNSSLATGGYIVSKSGSALTIENTTFGNVTRTTGNGSCVEFSSTKDSYQVLSISNSTFANCKIRENKKGGGGLYVMLKKPTQFCLVASTIESCSAPILTGTEGKGGGMMIDILDETFFSLSTLFMDLNQAEYGNDLFIYSFDLSSSANGDSFPLFSPSLPYSETSCVGIDSKWPSTRIPLVYYFLEKELVVSTSMDGSDVEVCGFIKFPCQSFDFSFSRKSNERKSIEVSRNYILNESLILDDVSGYSICGVNKTELVLNGKEGSALGIFEIRQIVHIGKFAILLKKHIPSPQKSAIFISKSSGIATIEDCAVLCDAGADAIFFPFLFINAGSLYLNRFSTSSIRSESFSFISAATDASMSICDATFVNVSSTNTKGLLSFSSCFHISLNSSVANASSSPNCGMIWIDNVVQSKLQNCSFNEVRKISGNGSALSGNVCNGCCLSLDSNTISACETKQGFGGGISVKLLGGGEFNVGKESVCYIERSVAEANEQYGGYGGGLHICCDESGHDFFLSQLTFGSRENTLNKASYGGKNVFLEGYSLQALLDRTSFGFNFAIEINKTDITELVGFESVSHIKPIPLVLFFRTFSPPAMLGNPGYDYMQCGYYDYPCSTIQFAENARFKDGTTSIKLLPSFHFDNKLVLNKQETVIDSLSTGSKISVNEEGAGLGEGLIESEVSFLLKNISFEIPSSLKIVNESQARECFLLCKCNTLQLVECSISKAVNMLNEQPEFFFAMVKGGCLIVNKLIVADIVFRGGGVFAIDETNNEDSIISEWSCSKVQTDFADGSLMKLKKGKSMRMQNCEFSDSHSEDGCIIDQLNECSLELKNVSFRDIKRRNGNGGILIGEIGFECMQKAENCTFWDAACEEQKGKGGGVKVRISEGATFNFNANKISSCNVSNIDGCGGGMHVEFLSSDMKYSLKSIVWSWNSGAHGRDLFAVCKHPRVVIIASLWSDTAFEDEAESQRDRLWVVDEDPALNVDTSLFDYLFPTADEIVFVNSGGLDANVCGYLEDPCDTVEGGFNVLGDEQSIIQIKSSAVLNRDLNRGQRKLTIRGNKTNIIMNIGDQGHLSLTSGNSQASLTLWKLNLVLPVHSVRTEFIDIFVGTAYISECSFGNKESSAKETNMKLFLVRGGILQISSVNIFNIHFLDNNTVITAFDGNVSLENCHILKTTSGGGSLIKGVENSIFFVKGTLAEQCEMPEGRAFVFEENSKIEIGGNCTFLKCKSANGHGGAIKCSLSSSCIFNIWNSTITGCEVSINKRLYGGGLSFDLLLGYENSFSLSSLMFSLNNAYIGKDLFVCCGDLNESITPERFDIILMENGIEKVDFAGTDKKLFISEPIDLLHLLVKYVGDFVFIDEDGIDILGCGKEKLPCRSMNNGFKHLDNNGISSLHTIYITNYGLFEESSLTVTTPQMIQSYAPSDVSISDLEFSSEIENSNNQSVIVALRSLSFIRLNMILPQSFAGNQKEVIRSDGGSIDLLTCKFDFQLSTAKYTLLKINQGTLTMKNCSMRTSQFEFVPIISLKKVSVDNCTFDGLYTPNSEKGGVFRNSVLGNDDVCLNSCIMHNCSCSDSNGKGGALFFDCSKCQNPICLMLVNVSFSLNEAYVGKNMFILSTDLNTTVTTTSFLFDYNSSINDEKSFQGSDSLQNDTDLLRFLVPRLSPHIYVSSNGFDVMRCGSKSDPCKSFWKGYNQLDKIDQNKKICICGSTIIQDEFVFLDSFIIYSSDRDDEDSMSTITISGKETKNDVEIVNKGSLSILKINVFASTNASNSDESVFCSISGILEFNKCLFSSDGRNDEPLRLSFILATNGVINVLNVCLKSFVCSKDIVNIRGFSSLKCNNISVFSVIITEGTFLNVHEQRVSNNNERNVASVNGSTFESVNSDSNYPCVLSCENSKNILFELHDNVFQLSKAATCLNGGIIMFAMNEESCLRIRSSSLTQCSCSSTKGRGGGIYLRTNLSGALNFQLKNISFTGNNAFLGRDMFIECVNIDEQINETQFNIDFSENVFVRQNAIYGIDREQHSSEPVNLMDYILINKADTIFVSDSDVLEGEDTKKCGSIALPCFSISYSLLHLSHFFESRLLIKISSYLNAEIDLEDILIESSSKTSSAIRVAPNISESRNSLIDCTNSVELSLLSFVYETNFNSKHKIFALASAGTLSLSHISFFSNVPSSFACVPFTLIFALNSEVIIEHSVIKDISFLSPSIFSFQCQSFTRISDAEFSQIEISESCINNIYRTINSDVANDIPTDGVAISSCFFSNITCLLSSNCIFALRNIASVGVQNCSFNCHTPLHQQDLFVSLVNCSEVILDSCVFDGGICCSDERKKRLEGEADVTNNICYWNGSIVQLIGSTSSIRETEFANSTKGALLILDGNARIGMGMFANNSPSIEKFPSIRRNVLCNGNSTLDVQSLKGGDGAMPNTSLWILSEGCKLEGIAGERASSLFIPTLDFIRKEMNGNMIELILLGTILLPCDLKLCIISSIESTEAIETYELEKNAFISEREVHCFIEGAKIDSVLAEVEVTAQILFGRKSIQKTNAIILKNRSELQEKRDGVAVKGENKAGTSWVIIVIAMGFILLIVLIGLIVFVVRWRRAKERTKELEEIVNDTVKKDPKAFEMVTMEMSPEEQWRRAEREAEKKNEERIKKRVYEKSLGHSESSEHLLSESGSTEYILGRDSDKIPEWMLEKVDEKEEEEIRKRTPSPSISSTSTTDSDSTFVRGEDLCPTTSSMSNLVDAMACSSPHEKLIVDLRDSLFMLLHGRNEKKEMAIGSLQERVFTAAQVLFWVANGALYSFDEDKELPSLAGLSSLIVLFSEHMVICIAMHSDCSDDSSDSSSVSSSSTIISSSSDCSSVNKKGRDSPPSSAFEDDEDNRKECMRWKAPELLINKKMRATKESVAFSIGMMLWECLTLEIPFGEYEAVTAGQKIVNGERPDIDLTEERGMWNVVRKCCSPDPLQRPTLSNLKREFIQHFPAGTVMLAVSDAIDLEQSSKEEGESTGKDTEALLS